MYKEECLSVPYAFSHRDSYRHQTLHMTSSDPKEDRRVISIPSWVKDRGKAECKIPLSS